MPTEGRHKLLILNRVQFGYLLDTYYYCKLAAERLQITHVSFDTGMPRLHLAGVEVKYVKYKGRKCVRFFRLLATFAREIRRHRHGAIFINYFPGCSLLTCLGRHRRMIVDIRTGSVKRNRLLRHTEDCLMRWECRLFPNVSVISRCLAGRLHLPPVKTHILPLGAERIRVEKKRFDRLDLLYVGTLDDRHIEETVVGFARFLHDYGARVALTYTIIGDSPNGHLTQLRRMVHASGLDGVVRLPGYVHRTQLQETFNRCNVGVSYVPMCDIYDCQPVTKTFEYIFAGMPVIATATKENQKVVNRLNGVLIQDTPESFYQGLKEVYNRRDEFDSDRIRRCCPDASWDRIVERDLLPYVHEVFES